MYRLLIGMLIFVLTPAQYSESIRQWQAQRNASLRSPDGWLALVGLFWLKEGDNTIGSGARNDLILPAGSAPTKVGMLQLAKGTVVFRAPDGSSRTLSFEETKPDVIHAGSVTFYVIKRGDKFAVRAKDAASPVLKSFAGMKYFPVNPALHIAARFLPEPKKIPILNIVGQTDLEDSPGVVEFSYSGQTYRLRPITEDNTLFFLFKDATNKTETYQAGRMLNTPMPVHGKVDLDFNRSYNPPCTFTPYATCPLPPKENTLPFAVTAGELRYGRGHVEYSATR